MEYEYNFFAVPEALIFAANQMAMVVGSSAADGLTFETPNSTDAAGNRYYARNIWASTGLIPALQQPIVRPGWDIDEVIDLDAAAAAQAALVFQTGPATAAPAVITVLTGITGPATFADAGLSQIPYDSEDA